MARPRGTVTGGLVVSFCLAAALLPSPPLFVLYGFGATILTVPAVHLLREEAADRGDVRRRCLAGLAGAFATTFVLGRLVAVLLPTAGDPAHLLLDCGAVFCGLLAGGLLVAGGYDRVID
ncbi:hypothetical protein J2752_001865 [Halarchaeum rubridurum]|uniref:Uncharacterized protein n=1 Tax=Halarchaeum rubridurum TaxID=489911 RepID=A0A830G0Y0_9EURY|nr:hypothetical protein [Halarchaeum rubridurum]MBP1954953.1 hypothetical protein [Halarchaeum rubridurum]GGM70140.1 hypothetical protein GCM10009017_20380 [Halarchaeum rubridurum]